jgi:hypothetical protein
MQWEKVRRPLSKKSGGIRRRLLIWGLALLGLTLVLNTLAGSIYTRGLIKEDVARLQSEIASRVAQEIGEFIRRKEERLLDLSAAASLYKFASKEHSLLAHLLLKNDSSFTEITFLDAEGKEVVKVSEREVYPPVIFPTKVPRTNLKEPYQETYTSVPSTPPTKPSHMST